MVRERTTYPFRSDRRRVLDSDSAQLPPDAPTFLLPVDRRHGHLRHERHGPTYLSVAMASGYCPTFAASTPPTTPPTCRPTTQPASPHPGAGSEGPEGLRVRDGSGGGPVVELPFPMRSKNRSGSPPLWITIPSRHADLPCPKVDPSGRRKCITLWPPLKARGPVACGNSAAPRTRRRAWACWLMTCRGCLHLMVPSRGAEQ